MFNVVAILAVSRDVRFDAREVVVNGDAIRRRQTPGRQKFIGLGLRGGRHTFDCAHAVNDEAKCPKRLRRAAQISLEANHSFFRPYARLLAALLRRLERCPRLVEFAFALVHALTQVACRSIAWIGERR